MAYRPLAQSYLDRLKDADQRIFDLECTVAERDEQLKNAQASTVTELRKQLEDAQAVIASSSKRFEATLDEMSSRQKRLDGSEIVVLSLQEQLASANATETTLRNQLKCANDVLGVSKKRAEEAEKALAEVKEAAETQGRELSPQHARKRTRVTRDGYVDNTDPRYRQDDEDLVSSSISAASNCTCSASLVIRGHVAPGSDSTSYGNIKKEPQDDAAENAAALSKLIMVETSPTFTFKFKAVRSYVVGGSADFFDSKEIPTSLHGPIRAVFNSWNSRKEKDLQSLIDVKIRAVGNGSRNRPCVADHVAGERCNWVHGYWARFACVECMLRGRPCFFWTGEEFRLLPLKPGLREESTGGGVGVGYWILPGDGEEELVMEDADRSNEIDEHENEMVDAATERRWVFAH